jgi:hypothetical protein
VNIWPEYAIPVMLLGGGFIAYGLWDLYNDRREKHGKPRLRMDPTHIIAGSLIIAAAMMVVAASTYAWQRYWRTPTEIAQTGEGGGKGGVLPEKQEWNDNARLTLIFDNELQAATASRQEGVRFYYWYHFPAVAVDFKQKKTVAAPGYVMVFLALQDPTHTNYSRVRVLGGGVLAEVMASHAAGAVVRAMGDMRGRTIDIWFSNKPIPVD